MRKCRGTNARTAEREAETEQRRDAVADDRVEANRTIGRMRDTRPHGTPERDRAAELGRREGRERMTDGTKRRLAARQQVDPLPGRFSDLLRTAVADAGKLPPEYGVNDREWHRLYPEDGKCRVCLAGAVLAARAGYRHEDLSVYDEGFGEDELALKAIDAARAGWWRDAWVQAVAHGEVVRKLEALPGHERNRSQAVQAVQTAEYDAMRAGLDERLAAELDALPRPDYSEFEDRAGLAALCAELRDMIPVIAELEQNTGAA